MRGAEVSVNSSSSVPLARAEPALEVEYPLKRPGEDGLRKMHWRKPLSFGRKIETQFVGSYAPKMWNILAC